MMRDIDVVPNQRQCHIPIYPRLNTYALMFCMNIPVAELHTNCFSLLGCDYRLRVCFIGPTN